jgi:hypothetical protein
MWRHGSSRTWVSFASKSSRQMGHVGWFRAEEDASTAVGADEWRTSEAALTPVPVSTKAEGLPSAGGGACGAAFSGLSAGLLVYVYMGSLSSICWDTFSLFTPNASRSTSPSSTRRRRSFRRLRWMMCIATEVPLTATMRMASTITRKTHKLGSWLPESVDTVPQRRT